MTSSLLELDFKQIRKHQVNDRVISKVIAEMEVVPRDKEFLGQLWNMSEFNQIIQFKSNQINSIHFNSINSIQFHSISFNSNIGAFQHIQGLRLQFALTKFYYNSLSVHSEKMEEQFNSIQFNSIQFNQFNQFNSIQINFRSFRSFSKSSRYTSNSINSFILYKQTQSIQFKK